MEKLFLVFGENDLILREQDVSTVPFRNNPSHEDTYDTEAKGRKDSEIEAKIGIVKRECKNKVRRDQKMVCFTLGPDQLRTGHHSQLSKVGNTA
jgi:hypothetical protein